MPSISSTLVNGMAYSYRDIVCSGLPGLSQLRAYLIAVNFTNAADGALNHGASQLGRHVSGPYTPTLDMEVSEEGWKILAALLPPAGYEAFPIGNFMISYAKGQVIPPFRRLRFNEVHILGSSAAWTQGTKELSRRIPTTVRFIEEDHGDGVLRCPINPALELYAS